MSKPPRSAMSMRDMVVALGVLVVIALVVGGVGRACSFSPGGPQVDPNAAPVVDAPADLARLAKTVPFPVRVPAVPPGWRANSTGLDTPGDGSAAKVVRVGYLTTDRHYVRLLQSDVPEETILRAETGAKQVPGHGPVDVGGQEWVVYGERGEEPLWIADVGPVRYLITGSGADADFRALAAAVKSGPVAPK